jgi:hypothetical protein
VRAAPTGSAALDALVVERVVAGRNDTKADVLLGRIDDRAVAVKDYRPRPAWVRWTLGRWFTGREARAYHALEGVPGLPRFLGRWGPCTLATARVPGRPLAELAADRVDAGTFDRLGAVLEAVHARGVALGDLHHRDVLVADDGAVHVVDLATAWVRGGTPWSTVVFRRLRDQDRIALARMRVRWLGGDETAAIAAVGRRALKWHRRGRAIRRAVDRLRGRVP